MNTLTFQAALTRPSIASVRKATAGSTRSLVTYRATAGRRASLVVAKASKTDDAAEQLQAKATELLEVAQAKWEATEEKPAVIAISAATFVAIWAASALVDGINKLPFFGSFFELVGLVVTAWFAWRYLIFGPDREELKKNIDGFFAKVAGNDKAVKKPTITPPAAKTNGATAERV